jgi:hypothetical protein
VQAASLAYVRHRSQAPFVEGFSTHFGLRLSQALGRAAVALCG